MKFGRQVFVDLDGVLGDLHGHYFNIFGKPMNVEIQDAEVWSNIRNYPGFHRTVPLLPGAKEFFEAVKTFDPIPIILTGVPRSVPEAAAEKREWVWEHFTPFTQVICCRSADKKVFGDPGDILIDDRLKYAHLWRKMGGVFIHHTSQKESLDALAKLLRVH